MVDGDGGSVASTHKRPAPKGAGLLCAGNPKMDERCARASIGILSAVMNALKLRWRAYRQKDREFVVNHPEFAGIVIGILVASCVLRIVYLWLKHIG